jgi:hypothetical protein
MKKLSLTLALSFPVLANAAVRTPVRDSLVNIASGRAPAAVAFDGAAEAKRPGFAEAGPAVYAPAWHEPSAEAKFEPVKPGRPSLKAEAPPFRAPDGAPRRDGAGDLATKAFTFLGFFGGVAGIGLALFGGAVLPALGLGVLGGLAGVAIFGGG